MACKPLDASSAKKLLSDVDSILLGCDGVLWDGEGLIPGSLEAVKQLKAMGKRVFYMSNNSTKTRGRLMEDCSHLGFPAVQEDITCVAGVAASYLCDRNFRGSVFLVGNQAMAAELNTVGIHSTGVGPDPTTGSIQELTEMDFDTNVKCVLVGFDPEISYMKILRAASHLQRPDVLFLATNDDVHFSKQFRTERNPELVVPGTGTMVTAVGFPAQRTPTVVGKPQPYMFEELKKAHNLDPKRCLIVGDRLKSDVGLARRCGSRSLIVLSGVTTDLDLGATLQHGGRSHLTLLPDFYAKCLGDLVGVNS